MSGNSSASCVKLSCKSSCNGMGHSSVEDGLSSFSCCHLLSICRKLTTLRCSSSDTLSSAIIPSNSTLIVPLWFCLQTKRIVRPKLRKLVVNMAIYFYLGSNFCTGCERIIFMKIMLCRIEACLCRGRQLRAVVVDSCDASTQVFSCCE